LSGGTKFLLKG